jgi:hypothetical protein
MSEAKWCDTGNHAFSATDEDAQHFSQTRTVKVRTGDNYGRDTYQERQVVTTEVDVCGPCFNKSNPFQKDASPAALPKDDGFTEEDKQDESYLRGYREGILKGQIIE